MQFKFLSDQQIDHFLEKGYVVIPQAFSHENADRLMQDVWLRLGFDPNDQSTWVSERTHMPVQNRELVATFAPKAWGAMCELLGGEERIDPSSATWGDSFIVNLGIPGSTSNAGPETVDPTALTNWHVDGDFFLHFLDSPEQALLVIPIFEDIEPRGGGTYIATDGIDMIAKHLAAHPEGVLPREFNYSIKDCKGFVELGGKKGDVVLMHPLMLHSASTNFTRKPRFITNPPVALLEPFVFSRSNPEDYSLVERKTLRALGVERLDFQIAGERKRIIPMRQIIQERMKAEEAERIRSAKGLGSVNVPISV